MKEIRVRHGDTLEAPGTLKKGGNVRARTQVASS